MSARLRDAAAAEHGASRDAMRRTMFLSQDGVVLCATLRALDELGVLEPSLADEASLAELHPELNERGFGALRIALHCLASTGWLAERATLEPRTTVPRWTEEGRAAAVSRRHYVALGELLAGFASAEADAWTKPWSPLQVKRFAGLVGRASERWGLGADGGAAAVVRAHLDGGLTVPAMLWLHETRRLGERSPDLPDDDAGEAIGRLLAALGWLDGERAWTPSGEQARAFALNFGGVATYLPMLARLPELFRGELSVDPPQDGGSEWHVHRELNLRISAAAHRRYFVDSDEIVAELFDREPIESQPRFIAEMGCGNGSWLIHLHELIAGRTRRGEAAAAQPLSIVGVDIDAEALAQARANLEAAGVPALLLKGDVTDPDGLRDALAEHGLAIEEGLHIRSFIDHERSYVGVEDPSAPAPGWASGVYIDAAGLPLAGEEVERDLIAHLARWERHTRRHGMIVLEAHCVAPAIARKQLGALHSVAFDAHQAYSKQYPVDHASFLRCCQQAGLAPLPHCERRYPSNRPFVSIGHNRLISATADPPLPASGRGAPREDTWTPPSATELEDGEALHEILFAGGDLRFPAAWGSGPTGFVVGGALEAIEERLARASRGETVRVLDYGAGTGTAAIELLKACRERRMEERLERAGIGFELHLVDLPSSWFAKGYELLRECAWTRFHSLRDPGGGFRGLPEATGGLAFDAAMANMVFHLIPPRARERAVDGLADVLLPGGRLLWSAPDLGPAGPYAVLLHDPNRALRERWLELLSAPAEGGGPGGLSTDLEEALRLARERFDEEALREAQRRADRRILPRPLAAEVVAALERRFSGEVELRAYEMLAEDIVRGLLVPSNQAEYLPEIPDRALRERVIRELMLDEVIPALQAGPAGTALGLSLHWTLGAFAKRA